MEESLPATGALDRLDYLRAALPQGIHLRDKLRRVLKVAVYHHGAVPGSVFQPGEYRALLAEVPGEAQSPDAGVEFVRRAYLRPGGIPGAVVNEQQLVFDSGISEHRGDSPGGAAYIFVLVE